MNPGQLDNRDRQELRRRRMAEAPAILRGGFRPFFLGAGVWGALAITIWLGALGVGAARIGALDPLGWHRHEMLFGFVGAAIGGFALTAVPNWTGRLPIAGAPLGALALWWLAARVLILAAPDLPLVLLAAIDGGFYLGLAALLLREILQAKNRNIPVAIVIGLFGLADLADYGGAAGWVGFNVGARSAIALAVTLVSLIGGRIVPSFTRNWMQRERIGCPLPTQPTRFDAAVVIATAIALAAWAFAGSPVLTGIALAAAAILQIARLARWRGWCTFAEPIVLVLHLGYLWIPIGLFLLSAASLGLPLPQSAGIHALTVGALAGMILAVMTRATLGHTGHALHADMVTRVSYLALHLGAAARVLAALLPEVYLSLIYIAGGLWIAAFALFSARYAPLLTRPRVGT